MSEKIAHKDRGWEHSYNSLTCENTQENANYHK